MNFSINNEWDAMDMEKQTGNEKIRDCNGMDLENETDVFMVMKKPIPLKVEFAKQDGVCRTKEGDVRYLEGDAIVTGTHGEQWPIPIAKFKDTYQPVDAENSLYAKKPMHSLAKQMSVQFSVNVSWSNDPILGKPGDWLLQYGKGDFGIVDKDIFDETYLILGRKL